MTSFSYGPPKLDTGIKFHAQDDQRTMTMNLETRAHLAKDPVAIGFPSSLEFLPDAPYACTSSSGVTCSTGEHCAEENAFPLSRFASGYTLDGFHGRSF
jgi:hypothetical protein